MPWQNQILEWCTHCILLLWGGRKVRFETFWVVQGPDDSQTPSDCGESPRKGVMESLNEAPHRIFEGTIPTFRHNHRFMGVAECLTGIARAKPANKFVLRCLSIHYLYTSMRWIARRTMRQAIQSLYTISF